MVGEWGLAQGRLSHAARAHRRCVLAGCASWGLPASLLWGAVVIDFALGEQDAVVYRSGLESRTGSYSVASGDLDGDGVDDLVVADRAGATPGSATVVPSFPKSVMSTS